MCPSLIRYFLQNPHFTLPVQFIFPPFSTEDIALVFYKEGYLETALSCILKDYHFVNRCSTKANRLISYLWLRF